MEFGSTLVTCGIGFGYRLNTSGLNIDQISEAGSRQRDNPALVIKEKAQPLAFLFAEDVCQSLDLLHVLKVEDGHSANISRIFGAPSPGLARFLVIIIA